MKDRIRKRPESMVLAIEALLVILSLAIERNALVGMICYWTIVAVYHLTDFLNTKPEDRDGI